ncbi:MAG: acyltransferase [Hyphomicrobiaceae bacterium]
MAAQNRPGATATRLAHIDGLRGVAILSVMLFHAYARWPDLMPFSSRYAVPPLTTGWVGVQLFFIISGFVIFMTLERSQTLAMFALQRFRRLFPAMLVATTVIVVSAPLLPERPQGTIGLFDPLAGLMFVDPKWWSLFGVDLKPVEGAFWSLFVEVQFYAVAGIAYVTLGRRGALAALIVVFALAQLATSGLLPSDSLAQRALFALTDRMGAIHYGWFIAGAALYLHARSANTTMLVLGLSSLVVSVVLATVPGSWIAGKLALASIAALFVAALFAPALQSFLAHPFWQFLGFVSYPLYLVHENMLVALTVKVGRASPWLPTAVMPFAGMIVVVVLAWLIARYGEPFVKRLIPAPARGTTASERPNTAGASDAIPA